MRSSVSVARKSMELNSLDGVQPRMVKAGQVPSIAVNPDQLGLTGIVRDALIAACGSLKSAAIQMGIDQGQLTRELQAGGLKLERLDRLTEQEKAVVVSHLHEAFAPMATSPQEQIERHLDAIQSIVNGIRQGVRHLAA